MSTSIGAYNTAIIIIDGQNGARNIIYGTSTGTVAGDIATSHGFVGGSIAYDELVGDASLGNHYRRERGKRRVRRALRWELHSPCLTQASE